MFGMEEGWLPADLFVITTWHDNGALEYALNFVGSFEKNHDSGGDTLVVFTARNNPVASGTLARLL